MESKSIDFPGEMRRQEGHCACQRSRWVECLEYQESRSRAWSVAWSSFRMRCFRSWKK